MGRNGISFGQVAAVADALVAEGVTPSTLIVRDKLGTGCHSTVQRLLNQWRDNQPLIVPAPVEFNKDIANVINQAIAQAKAEARAEVEKRFVISQEESERMLEYCESLESELDKACNENAAMTESRDVLLNDSQEKKLTIEMLSADNDRERYSAEVARTEVAKCQIKLELQDKSLKEQSDMISLLKVENAASIEARTVAEREAAVFEARFKAEQEKSMALQSDKAALTAQLTIERQAAETARNEATKATADLTNQAVILTQKVALVEKLSASIDAEKNLRSEAESTTKELGCELKAAKVIAESAVTELEKKVSEINELAMLYEAEKQAHKESMRCVSVNMKGVEPK